MVLTAEEGGGGEAEEVEDGGGGGEEGGGAGVEDGEGLRGRWVVLGETPTEEHPRVPVGGGGGIEPID